MQFIPASDVRFYYAGRFDLPHPIGPMMVWPGSRVEFDFEGNLLALHFAEASGQNYFDLQVDHGPREIVAVAAGGGVRIELPAPWGAGRHRLTLFKRTEAEAGSVRFSGVEIEAGAQVWAPTRPETRLRMEFFGDSVMVGACNEDGATDQWEDRRTHNHSLSYTTLTAEAFSADYRCMAVSGMGIVTGYVEVTAGQVWDRLYRAADSAPADLKAWQPDVALINFGENDDSFTRNQQQPFPVGFAAGYVALIRGIRAAYPRARLVVMRGGMFGGARSASLREAWEQAAKEIEVHDPAISQFIFKHWSENHPRVSDHRAMAAELIAWLSAQEFMREFQ